MECGGVGTLTRKSTVYCGQSLLAIEKATWKIRMIEMQTGEPQLMVLKRNKEFIRNGHRVHSWISRPTIWLYFAYVLRTWVGLSLQTIEQLLWQRIFLEEIVFRWWEIHMIKENLCHQHENPWATLAQQEECPGGKTPSFENPNLFKSKGFSFFS